MVTILLHNMYFLFSECNTEGSAGYWPQYNTCICKANIVGDNCGECAAGFSGYPSCKAGGFEKKNYKGLFWMIHESTACINLWKVYSEKDELQSSK